MGKKVVTKVPVSRLIWQWTEDVSPENVTDDQVQTAYRLKLGKCKTCRKNCTGNPNCLRGLGESQWFRERSHRNVVEENLEESENERRQAGQFVGLRNLGATCYVNTLLQLWFHNLKFRNAVFTENDAIIDHNDQAMKTPQTICGQLQLIFGLLQSGVRKNIDPTPLINCLGLDTGQQQDAQEFSKLFLHLLESMPSVGDFLRQEFRGEYDYHTTCNTCGHVSRRPSQFYELDLSIQGHKNLIECLGEFFKEEQLNCENQYHCDSCNCKRDAARRIAVRSLPRTLNLQLLRFVFDKTTWNKKKLSSVISFPEVLDMSTYVSLHQIPAEDMIYELSAVLIHGGPSAFSGHYIAHIKDSLSQLWYKFNDESISQMKSGKTLDLDGVTEDDYVSDILQKPAKKPRLKKSHHSSKNAYMLVYTRKTEINTTAAIPEVPVEVRKAVDEDSRNFESCLNIVLEEAQQKADEDEKRYIQMSQLVKAMHDPPCDEPLESVCFVPTTWLKQILDSSQIEKKNFSSEKFLCSHKKLDPDHMGSMKCISRSVFEKYLSLFKVESHMIPGSSLCHQCVKERCATLRLKASLREDDALVNKLLKETHQVEYIVGRTSLRYWKTLAMGLLRSNKTSEDGVEFQSEDLGFNEREENSNGSDENHNFNEDLLCDHANLTTNSKQYRIVSTQVWNILAKYFPTAPCYKIDSSISCRICVDNDSNEAQAVKVKNAALKEQKTILSDLFHNKNRPTYNDIYGINNSKHPLSSFYSVSAIFIEKWREWLKSPSKYAVVSEICNAVLLCPHGKLICDPVMSSTEWADQGQDKNFPSESNECYTVLLWPREWECIVKYFVIDIPIIVGRSLGTDGCDIHTSSDSRGSRIMEQEDPVKNNVGCKTENPCKELSSEDCNGFAADGKMISGIRVLGDADSLVNSNDVSEIKANIESDATISPEKASKGIAEVELKYDPQLCMDCIEGKALEKERNLRNYTDAEIYIRKMVADSNTKFNLEMQFPVDVTSVSSTSSVRRSKRTHTTRGEKKVTVSSQWTLKQLKIKIMSLFSIPPFDQNIWLGYKKLTDDEATLGSLSIFPGSSLTVVADEPDEKCLELLPVISPKKKDILEEGFKGTSLLRS